MKSQPEYPIRRLAVFGGYAHPGPEPTYARVTRRETSDPAEGSDANRVIAFERVARLAEMQRAA